MSYVLIVLHYLRIHKTTILLLSIILSSPLSFSAEQVGSYDELLDALANLQNPEQELLSLTQDCEFDNPQACSTLALMYELGLSVEIDQKKSSNYFLTGCSKGSSHSCVGLATHYYEGIYMDRDPKLAFSFFEKGCNIDGHYGCTDAGLMLLDGLDLKKNIDLALQYLKIGCDSKDGDSCTALTSLFHFGGVANIENVLKPDHNLALIYDLKGCELNQGYSCGLLSVLHYEGTVTPHNLPEAIYYANLGCNLYNDEYSCELVDFYKEL